MKNLSALLISLLLGIISSLTATYLYVNEISVGWWFKLLIVLAILLFISSFLVAIRMYTRMQVALAQAIKYEKDIDALQSKHEVEMAKCKSYEIELNKEKLNTAKYNELQKEVASKGEYINKIIEANKNYSASLDKLQQSFNQKNDLLEDLRKCGVVGYIDNMNQPEFSKIIENNFYDSKTLYVLASRGYTLFGSQIEPFHSLFRSLSKEETSLRKKDVKIVLSNPILNLERTKRIMELKDSKNRKKILESYYSTFEEILKLSEFSDLQLKLNHQTATWRLIIFDNIILVSSYKRVKKLPIYVIECTDYGLYDGFLYHFEKIFEVSQQVNNLSEFKTIVKQSQEIINNEDEDFIIKINKDISGI
ncbi:MAG: hypothetical protein PVF73_11190 [Bacteroidales bacterium]|jgi:hypothetical protein